MSTTDFKIETWQELKDKFSQFDPASLQALIEKLKEAEKLRQTTLWGDLVTSEPQEGLDTSEMVPTDIGIKYYCKTCGPITIISSEDTSITISENWNFGESDGLFNTENIISFVASTTEPEPDVDPNEGEGETEEEGEDGDEIIPPASTTPETNVTNDLKFDFSEINFNDTNISLEEISNLLTQTETEQVKDNENYWQLFVTNFNDYLEDTQSTIQVVGEDGTTINIIASEASYGYDEDLGKYNTTNIIIITAIVEEGPEQGEGEGDDLGTGDSAETPDDDLEGVVPSDPPSGEEGDNTSTDGSDDESPDKDDSFDPNADESTETTFDENGGFVPKDEIV